MVVCTGSRCEVVRLEEEQATAGFCRARSDEQRAKRKNRQRQTQIPFGNDK
jgi:hypothetical protein